MKFGAKLAKFLKIKNPYLVSLPLVGTTTWSVYSVVQNGNLVSSVEQNYLARVELTSYVSGDSGSNSKVKIHGQEVNFGSVEEVIKLARQDKQRLFNYYRNYDSKNLSVSADDVLSTNGGSNHVKNINFFVHLRDKNVIKNENNFWLENVKLNQLTIDRYGYEYDDKGAKKADSHAKTHTLVDWKDIELDKLAKEEDVKKLPSISFRIYKSIPKDEVSILANEEEGKYAVEENDSSNVSKDWFVWLDKDLLTLKLNYALQTYSFKQELFRTETQVKQILGDDAEGKTINDTQQAKRKAVDSNFENLPEGYEQFAKDYIQLFLDTAATDKSVNWAKVINNVTQTDSFIKTDDLNKIYNTFKKQKKETKLFNTHLITKITSGATGTWKVSLNLDKDESSTEEAQKDKPDAITKKYEAREIKALTDNESLEDRNKNIIHLVHDPELFENFNVNEVFDRVSRYSVKYFTFSKTPKTISSTYTSSTDSNESIKLINFQNTNEFGIYVEQQWIPIILALVFLGGILYYLIVAFRGPGTLLGISVVASVANVAGVFFALGSQLSLIGIFGAFIGIFYTLFLSYYSLGFLKKVFDIEFLDASNVWVVFKRGLVMATDISLPFFIFSTLLVFLSPLHVREFGIVLALFALFSYLFVSVMGCLMSIKRSSSKFIQLGKFFQKKPIKEDPYLSFCRNTCSNTDNAVATSAIAVLLLVLGVVICALAWGHFNSNSFLKENVLVIGKEGTKDTLQATDLSNASYTSLSGSNYLVHNLPSGTSDSLKTKAFVTSTGAFSDFYTIKDLGFSFLCSLGLIFIYVFIRFKFKNLLILAINVLTIGTFFSVLLLITRIPITSSIVIAYCSILILVVLYHIVSFGLDKEQVAEWHAPLVNDIKQGIFSKMAGTIAWFTCVSALTGFTNFWMIAIYVVLAIVLAHLLSGFLYKFWFVRLNFIKNTYMWETKKTQEREEESLDLYDEEIIEGINKRY